MSHQAEHGGQRVYDAICDLSNTSRPATRQVIADITGLALTVVDYHTKVMTNEGRLMRPTPGVYAPVPPAREDRAVSMTILPNGQCKLEIGDDIVELTMREARHISAVTGGINLQFQTREAH